MFEALFIIFVGYLWWRAIMTWSEALMLPNAPVWEFFWMLVLGWCFIGLCKYGV